MSQDDQASNPIRGIFVGDDWAAARTGKIITSPTPPMTTAKVKMPKIIMVSCFTILYPLMKFPPQAAGYQSGIAPKPTRLRSSSYGAVGSPLIPVAPLGGISASLQQATGYSGEGE
jgi:hypothetical protein